MKIVVTALFFFVALCLNAQVAYQIVPLDSAQAGQMGLDSLTRYRIKQIVVTGQEGQQQDTYSKIITEAQAAAAILSFYEAEANAHWSGISQVSEERITWLAREINRYRKMFQPPKTEDQ